MSDVATIAKRFSDLPPPARLRLAANPMEQQRGDLAHAIAAIVVDELCAAIALRRLERPITNVG